jgi:hypothetical protein
MTDYTSSLNLPLPDQGNTNWKQYHDARAYALDDIGNLFQKDAYVSGILSDEEIVYDGWFPQEDITITKVGIFCRVAPTGANVQIDLLVNGAEQTKIASLTDGSTYELTSVIDLDVTSGQRVGIRVKQIGSTLEGEDMTVTLYFKKKAIAQIL